MIAAIMASLALAAPAPQAAAAAASSAGAAAAAGADQALIAATPLAAEFVDYKWRNDVPPGWERFTMALTNESGAAETLRVCPVDVQMVLIRPGRPHRNSFALAFDDANWSFECEERALAPGESTKVKLYFRQSGMWGLSREIKVSTNLGKFVMGRDRLGQRERSRGVYSVTTAG